LFQSLRRALRSDEPLDLLALVSGLLEVTDPRSRDPFARDERRTGLAELVESFVGTSYAETTAALMAMRALVPDEVMAGRIGRELATRRHPMPDWLSGLARARVEHDVWFLTHVLGDGDDYLLGVSLPSGHALSALVYVDHNLGTVAKDAFVVPDPLEDLALKVGTTIDDPDQSLTRTDHATARAVMEAAIEHGSRLYSPLSSESWPMCRPLVEWIWFGVKGSVSSRAEPLLRANGVDPHGLYGAMDLGAPDLLTSKRRADIIASRDTWLCR